MTHYILAIDQGTTNSKALLVDGAGQIVARGSAPLDIRYPRPAWVEQDALDIWGSVRRAMDECLERAGRPPLAAVAVTNQRETVMIWERATGRPLGPAVSWQCQRGAALCEALRARPGLSETIHRKTGLTLDAMFSGSKWRWLLDQVPDGRARATRGELCLGTMDAWVLWNLTGGRIHACDMTNASRTLLFDLRALDWDDELLDAFGLPRAALPKIKPSSALYGATAPLGALKGGTPIACLIGDSHGALFGHASFQPGAVKATYGTGSSLMSAVPDIVLSQRGISTTIAWGLQAPAGPRATYALEGNIYVTGAAVQWLSDLLALGSADEVERLAAQVEDTGGVYLVPAFTGLGAPHWSERARGLICGLTRGATRAHLARATLESIAYQVRDVLDAMEADSGAPLSALLADGGASQNALLMQFQADLIGRPVLRCASPELSALGAAYLAGMAIGLWPTLEDIARLKQPTDRFEPRMAPAQRQALYGGWREALARAMHISSQG